MFSVALYQPEIPPNTGNIIRLCANTGSSLHLVGRLGFDMEDRQLRRAGLDYHEFSRVARWPDWTAFRGATKEHRLVGFSTRHRRRYDDFAYAPGDILLFGAESAGLPDGIRADIDTVNRLTIPMVAGNRSLNLANSVAIVLYEAWRQSRFAGADSD